MRQNVHGTELIRKGRGGWHGGGGEQPAPMVEPPDPPRIKAASRAFPPNIGSFRIPLQPRFGSSPASFAPPPRRTFARLSPRQSPPPPPDRRDPLRGSANGREEPLRPSWSWLPRNLRGKQSRHCFAPSSAPFRPLFPHSASAFLPFPPQKKKLYDIAKLQERPP